MIVTAEELEAIRRQAIEEYPSECCGVIVVRGDERRLVRCRNVQDELHARDPLRHPREARTAYSVDPLDLLKIARMEGDGYRVALIYHSHVDAGAYFSPTDRAQAVMEGQPIYPEATYLVASVVGSASGDRRRVAAVAAFRWDSPAGDFVEIESPHLPHDDEEPVR